MTKPDIRRGALFYLFKLGLGWGAGLTGSILLLALSSVGIPSAISKLAAQTEAAGNHRRSEEIFHTAIALFLYLAAFHRRAKKDGRHDAGSRPARFSLSAGRAILSLSLPVSMASIISSIGRVIDTGIIARGITAAFAKGIPGQDGAPIASAVCYLIASPICFMYLRKAVSLTVPVEKYLLKPVLCPSFMGAVSLVSYRSLYRIFASSRIAGVLAILISALFYILAVVKCGILSAKGIRRSPPGAGRKSVLPGRKRRRRS